MTFFLNRLVSVSCLAESIIGPVATERLAVLKPLKTCVFLSSVSVYFVTGLSFLDNGTVGDLIALLPLRTEFNWSSLTGISVFVAAYSSRTVSVGLDMIAGLSM